jgi:SAM-dependent methyltransferase
MSRRSDSDNWPERAIPHLRTVSSRHRAKENSGEESRFTEAAVMERRMGRNGKIGCWQWTYSNDIPDASYDCVVVMQSTQHCDDWAETGPELLRIMKPGRRIVFAEMVLAGPRFMEKIRADVHINQWFDKMFPGGRDTISNYSGEEIKAAFGDHCDGPQTMEWHGIEMFWGRKPLALASA